ncbi:nucleotidyltransferase domain-containing protein [Candidatus Woesearchaeota archaeon]|nr:nucleotidyltransferase domain-containing protein [Candidatus Woesearchaeota archaeon]
MVNIYKLKLTQLQNEILKELYKKTGVAINQRQLSIKLNVSQPAIKKSLPVLETLYFIIVQKDTETKRLSITLNTQNHKIIQLKRAENLKQIYLSGLAEVLEKEYAGATIILFGSYSRGEDTINSDLDIAIIGRKEKKTNLSNYEKEIERKININFYESFDKIHKHLKENLANGIIITGGFEL